MESTSIWTIDEHGQVRVYGIVIPLNRITITKDHLYDSEENYLVIFNCKTETLNVYQFDMGDAQIYDDTELYEGPESANAWISCTFMHPRFVTNLPHNESSKYAMVVKSNKVFILNTMENCIATLTVIDHITHHMIHKKLSNQMATSHGLSQNMLDHYLETGSICEQHTFYCNCRDNGPNCMKRRKQQSHNVLHYQHGFYNVKYSNCVKKCFLAKLASSDNVSDPNLLSHYIIFIINDDIHSDNDLFCYYCVPDVVANMLITANIIDLKIITSFNDFYKKPFSRDTVEDYYMMLALKFPKEHEYCVCGF